MSKNGKTGLVPKYRFPEFFYCPDWEKTTLNELLFETKQRNRELIYSREEVLSVSGEYGCVNQIELLGRSYAGESVKEYHIVETGDIVYTKSPLKRNPFGIIKENKGPTGIVSTLYAVYRTTPEGCASYLDQYFSGEYNLNSYLQPIVRKGAKNDMKVNNAAVLGGEIIVPKLKEQQKIADCLFSLDDLISAEDKKLAALKDHKKGLMQKLFPADGKTLPEWRFPQFGKSGEWEEKSLSKLCDMQAGKFVQAAEIHAKRKNNMYPCYGGNGLRGYTYSFTHSGEYPLIGRQGALCGNITYAMGDFHATEHAVVVTKRSKVSAKWLYYLLIKMNLNQYATGQAQPGLSVQMLKKIKTCAPKYEKEQHIIADCLSALDFLITAQAEKIEALKAHKKGLMQGLFPFIEEVGE
jgi:type I restriction enzyme S subunit